MRILGYQPRIIYPDVPQLQLADYEAAIAYFMERFQREFAGENAVYQFGAIRTPGVSDIDLLIVVNDEHWKQAREIAQTIISSSGSLYYLFAHEPLTICQSLLPHIRLVHTLENIKFLSGSWDPIGQPGDLDQLTGDARLFRHAIWNSIMRVSASAFEDATIGLRHSLVLVNNLLTSARRGNEFLSQPVAIPFSTEEMRAEVMSTSLPNQDQLLKGYIRQVIEYLNTVDSLIDQDLASKIGLDNTHFDLLALTKRRFIAAPLSISTTKAMIRRPWDRLLNAVDVIPVPAYPLVLSVFLARECRNDFPEYRVLQHSKLQISGFEHSGFMQYIDGVKAASIIFKKYRMDYFLPKPFSIKPIKMSGMERTVQAARQLVARKILSGEIN